MKRLIFCFVLLIAAVFILCSCTKEYILTYDFAGGMVAESFEEPIKWSNDTSLPQPETERLGYTFGGWSVSEGDSVKADTIVTAIWIANEYTVSFDAAGGSFSNDAPTPLTFTYDETAIIYPPDPSRIGYIFTGWSEPNYSSSDFTLFALWEARTYAVTFDLAEGEAADNTPLTQTVVFGDDEVLYPADPVKTGYTFNMWSDTLDYESDTQIVTALWTPNTYTVSFSAAGGLFTDNIPSPQTFIYDEENINYPSDPILTGYVFAGWSEPDYILPEFIIEAKWNERTYTFTFNPDGGSVTNGVMLTQTFLYTEGFKEPVLTRDNYNFLGWDKTYDYTADSCVYTALWKRINYNATAIFEDFVRCTVHIDVYNSKGEAFIGGTGVIISADGKIATCLHVIAGESDIRVKLSDGSVYKAEYICGFDKDTDLAVLKINRITNDYLTPIQKISEADTSAIFCLGIPDDEYEVCSGVFTAYNKELGYYCIKSVMVMEPGFSGGPTFDLHGRLIGINTAKDDEGNAYSGSAIYLNALTDGNIKLSDFATKTIPYAMVRYVPDKNNISIYDDQVVTTIYNKNDKDTFTQAENATRGLFCIIIPEECDCTFSVKNMRNYNTETVLYDGYKYIYLFSKLLQRLLVIREYLYHFHHRKKLPHRI
ncbi:MAG: InlB B-repeat-containing protein [Eubacteriales bacterium]|nr:InlB B-repeat-containing protein [Eubacteriales bacterium]